MHRGDDPEEEEGLMELEAVEKLQEQNWGKPKCRGCVYAGKAIPCEYILVKGRSPQKDGAHIDPEGQGGCELYDPGMKRRKRTPILPEKKRREGQRWRKVDSGELLRMWKEGKTDGEMAEAMDCTKRTIREWRQRMQLTPRVKRQRRSRLDTPDLRQAWEEGAGDTQLAELAGASRTSVQKWRARNGLACNDKRYRRGGETDAGTLLSGAGDDGAAGE